MQREELLKKIKQKISVKKLNRNTKKNKNKLLEKGFKSQGIDYEKLKKDVEDVRKQGGLTINLNT